MDSGWWMNRGFSSARIAAYASTSMSYWAVSGSRPPKASSTISLVNATKSRIAREPVWTKMSPA